MSCHNFIEESTTAWKCAYSSIPFLSLSLSLFRAHPAAWLVEDDEIGQAIDNDAGKIEKGCSWSLDRVQRQTSGPVRY